MTPKRIAIQSAKRAGAELLKRFKTLQRSNIKAKSKHEVITPADLASEKIILTAIKKHFPTHRILSEEKGRAGAKQSDYLWIIDPLDGTTNFSMGNPLFSISIALAQRIYPERRRACEEESKDPVFNSKNNENDKSLETQDYKIILGIIYVPFLNDLYIAEINKPSTLNNKKIKVSNENKIKNAFLTYCHAGRTNANAAIKIYQKLKPISRDLRQIGSAAIELGWVARGKTECIIIPGVPPWDVAAGALLVRQAGGICTDLNGQEWTLNSEGIIASNKNISTKLIKIVRNIK